MKVKKLLAGILSAAMVLGTMAFPASAATTSEMSYADFYAKCTADDNGNIIFDGATVAGEGNKLTVTVQPHTVCWLGDGCDGADTCCAGWVAPTDADPTKLDDKSNSELIQYCIGKGAKNVTISNVNFVYEKAAAPFCFHKNTENKSHNNDHTKIDPTNGQLQTLNSGDTTFKNCSFTNMDLSIYGLDNAASMANTTATVEGCEFNSVKYGSGIKWIRTQHTVIKNNSFTKCKSGVMVMPVAGVPSVEITGNSFDAMEYELVQLGGSTTEWANATNVTITGNTAVNPTATTSVFRVENAKAKVTSYSNDGISSEIPSTGVKSLFGATISSDGTVGIQNWSDKTDKLVKVGDNTYKTLAEALKAVYMSKPTDAVTIECKAGANVGSMSHAHVADDIVINGNGATVSGDLEIDMYTYSRETGKNVTSGGEYLTKDITVKVNDLNGVAAWGQRHTDKTITLEFNNCKNMHEVMFRTSPVSDSFGSMNITLNGCSFDVDNGAVKGTSVHITSDADITLKNCTFNGIAAPINLNNKSAKAQTLNVEGCTFTNCALEAETKALDTENDKPSTYAAPIRCVTTQETGTINATVKGCTFTNCSTIGHGDILLGDGREGKKSTNGAQVTVSGTTATVKTEFPGAADKTNTVEVKADETATVTMQEASNAVAKIGDVGYATLAEATAAATENDVITIIGKIAVAANDIPKNKTLNFVGQDETSELDFSGAAAFGANNSNLTFKSLTINWGNLGDNNGGNYHGIQHSGDVLYEDCTINGRFNLYGETETFRRCVFVQDVADYNLWTYGAGEATFDTCTFKGLGKAINVYKEGYDGTTPYKDLAVHKVIIKNCTFEASNGIGKAAIEINSELCPFDVTISESSATGFSEGSTTGNTLYNIKKMRSDISDSKNDKTSLTVDNEKIDLEKIRKYNSTWTYDTDSGYFTVDGEKSGVMRFMFKIDTDKAITEVGIKYINAGNIPDILKGSTVAADTGLNAFQGDITGIKETDAADGAKYYAAAYVVTTDKTTIWSDMLECSMNWAQEFTTTDGGAE